MIESLIEQYATNFFGRWIRNFSKNNLKVSVVSGTITMSNVEVNTDELEEFMSPFTPKFIYMGRLFVDIPLLPTRPLVVEISDLYFLLAAQDLTAVPPEALTKALQVQVYVQFLQKKIQEALREEAEKSANEPGGWAKTSDSKFHLPHLVQQMRLNIRHIHMRVEAVPPSPGGSNPPFFAFGTVTRELRMCSIEDEKALSNGSEKDKGKNGGKQSSWQKLFGKKTPPKKVEEVEAVKNITSLDKLFLLKEVDVYWSNDNIYQDMPAELAVGLMRTGVSVTASVTPLLFQTSHLRIQTRIELSPNSKLVNSILLELSLGQVEMDLCNNQLEYLMFWFDYVWNYRNAMQLRSLGLSPQNAPPASGGGLTRSWRATWRRAIGIVRRQIRQQWFKAKDKNAVRWRGYFQEWLIARRYVGIRELIHRQLIVKNFQDALGTTHKRLYEGLKVDKANQYQQPHQLGTEDIEVAQRLLKGYIQQSIEKASGEDAGNPSRLGSMRFALSGDMMRALYALQLDMDCTERLSLCAGARAIADSRLRFQTLLANCACPDQGLLLIRVLSADNVQPTTSWSEVEAVCDIRMDTDFEDDSQQKRLSTNVGYYNATQRLVTWNQTLRFLTPVSEEKEAEDDGEDDFSLDFEIKSRLLMMDSSCGTVKLQGSDMTSQPMDIVTHNVPLQPPAGLRLLDARAPLLNMISVFFPAGTDPKEIEPIERAIQMMGTMDHLSLTGVEQEEEDPICVGHKGVDLIIRCLHQVEIKVNIGMIVFKINCEDVHEEGSEPGFTTLLESRSEEIRAQTYWKVQESKNKISVGAKGLTIIDHQCGSKAPLLSLGPSNAQIFANGLDWRTLCLENPMLQKLLTRYFSRLPWDFSLQTGSYKVHVRDAITNDKTKDLWEKRDQHNLDLKALERKRFGFFRALTRLSTGKQNEIFKDNLQGAFLSVASVFRSLDFEVKYRPQGFHGDSKNQCWSICEESLALEEDSEGEDEPTDEIEKRKIVAQRIKELEEEIEELKHFL